MTHPCGSRLVAFTLYAYVLAALFVERRQHEAVLEESETRLQEALTAGAVTAFEWDPRKVCRSAARTPRTSWALAHSTLLPPPNSSRGFIRTTAHLSRRSSTRSVWTARPIQSPFVSFAPTAGRCGLRKRQEQNSMLPG